MTRPSVLAALAATCLLTACGGGGSGSGGSGQPFDETATIRAAIGGAPLTLDNAAIRSALGALEQRTDRINLTNVLLAAQYGWVADCPGTTSCRVAGADYYLSDFRLTGGNYAPVMTRNGMHVFQGVNRFSIGGDEDSYETYGGWGEHSLFLVFATDEVGAGLTAGDATGSRPTDGTATWRGVMVGGDLRRNEAFQGDAALTADFANAHLDVAFTNVHEVVTGKRRNAIRFANVPFTADGFATGNRQSGGQYIEGTFYGPNHAEAGGVFETDQGNRFGAFGARRTE